MTRQEVNREVYLVSQQINEMTAAEIIDFMSSLYPHDLTVESPIEDLRIEAKRQCRRDFEGCLSDSDRESLDLDRRFIAAVARGEGNL